MQVRAMAEIINSGIQPFQNNTTLNMIGDGCNDWAKRHIEYGFRGKHILSEVNELCALIVINN